MDDKGDREPIYAIWHYQAELQQYETYAELVMTNPQNEVSDIDVHQPFR